VLAFNGNIENQNMKEEHIMDISSKIKIAGVKPLNLPTPEHALPLLTAEIEDGDDRLWMKLTDTVYSRPLAIFTSTGGWIEFFKSTTSGFMNRHRHDTPVMVYGISGSWGYLEHEWIASPGSFLYEPVGESHTFVVYSNEGMKGLAHMFGPITFIDEDGKDLANVGALDVLDKYKNHCAEVGLGAEYAESLIR
jgi:2,4'-dihydroxyacetophenone dioxygenase